MLKHLPPMVFPENSENFKSCRKMVKLWEHFIWLNSNFSRKFYEKKIEQKKPLLGLDGLMTHLTLLKPFTPNHIMQYDL